MNSIFIQIDENPNCAAMDGQIFQPRSEPRIVRQVQMERWCEVTGLDENWKECEAKAYLIDDSGDGACYLVVGGAWGLHFKDGDREWGEPYLLLGADGEDLKFA
ncbi:MAG TPA: hypothetical protein VG456_00770 [Candidatus Sulfopaludibacter sp.]|jgi:hypothetical protein|nr:hypothetical protein [Candidatus Sulfopaludibacter sp.]